MEIRDRVSEALSRLHPDASRFALDTALRDLHREQAVEDALTSARMVDPQWSADRDAMKHRLEADSTDRARRRQAEGELADYIERVGREYPTQAWYFRLDSLVERMRNCRKRGTVGARPGGGYVVCWDSKCDQVRLCPDEAREETQRIAAKYVPAMLAWKREKPAKRRLFWAVLTLPNYPAGRLAQGKKEAFDRFRSEIVHGKYQACPIERRGRGYVKTRKRSMKKFPNLKGAMAVQEDPLSAGGLAVGADWNVHLNVILCVEGAMDYAELRREWGANLEIRELKGEEDALRSAVLECVKYAALAVPSKSAEKRSSGETDAPAMVEWPAKRWLEWWGAQQGFRRTRSYGCLYRVPPAETISLDDVEWIGTLDYAGGMYTATVVPPSWAGRVDLIPGNNFSSPGGGIPPPDPGGGLSPPAGYH